MNKTSLMKNKKGLVMGVANERSIAWAIAKELFNAGAEIALILGENELEKKQLTVKYLRDEKPQVTIKYSEISNFLSKALSI